MHPDPSMPMLPQCSIPPFPIPIPSHNASTPTTPTNPANPTPNTPVGTATPTTPAFPLAALLVLAAAADVASTADAPVLLLAFVVVMPAIVILVVFAYGPAAPVPFATPPVPTAPVGKAVALAYTVPFAVVVALTMTGIAPRPDSTVALGAEEVVMFEEAVGVAKAARAEAGTR